jgi:hypothetical protein
MKIRGHDHGPAEFQALVIRFAQKELNRRGLPMVPYQCGMKYALALARVLRRYEGDELADELALLWQKWQAMGMDPRLMTGLADHVCIQLTGGSPPVKGTVNHEDNSR